MAYLIEDMVECSAFPAIAQRRLKEMMILTPSLCHSEPSTLYVLVLVAVAGPQGRNCILFST